MRDERGWMGANAIARVALPLRPSTREKRKNARRTALPFARDHLLLRPPPTSKSPVMSES